MRPPSPARHAHRNIVPEAQPSPTFFAVRFSVNVAAMRPACLSVAHKYGLVHARLPRLTLGFRDTGRSWTSVLGGGWGVLLLCNVAVLDDRNGSRSCWVGLGRLMRVKGAGGITC